MNQSSFDSIRHASEMRSQGLWLDRSVDDYFYEAVRRWPNKTALVAYRVDHPDSLKLTYKELERRVDLATNSLKHLGIGKGDIVAIQLPNWWQFVVLALACGRVGAVVNPLMPIFREHELKFMINFSQPKLLVVPKVFRSFDHASMAQSLREQVPSLKYVAVVDDDGGEGFQELLQSERSQLTKATDINCDDLAVLMFTSGTTGEPKGVMHNNNTLIACTTALAQRFHLDTDDVHLCCSPLGHMTGYAAVMLQSIMLGGTLVLQDIWDPKRGVEIMAQEGVSHMAASTPFLADICETVASGSVHPQQLSTFLCGGAPIPPVLIDRAIKELGVDVCSLWGMTETLGATLTEPERALEKSSSTDGSAVPGMEVKVVNSHGDILPIGETGSLIVRGAQMFLGYYKRPDIVTFDTEGWFETGDLAYMDAEGYIRINGRIKDVLIRGGENVPVFEIESLLYKHPAVLSTAIVGYPDDRLGERSCAFVVLRPGANFDLLACQEWMAENKVAKQYWPERIEIIKALPATASGKIQKFTLRERAKAFRHSGEDR